MRTFRRAILIAAGCLAVLSGYAMGTPEVLRYPVAVGTDGSLTIRAGTAKESRVDLPPSSPDGYRFSFQGSYYELVTYSSGRYAVISLDPYLRGRSKGHTVFLKGRAEPDKPIPEWVSDDRYLLTGLPEYSGALAFRFSQERALGFDKKRSAQPVLADRISRFALLGVPESSDQDKAAARCMGEDLAADLAPGAEFSSYWMEFLKATSSGSPKNTDYTPVRRQYWLAVVEKSEYERAVREMREAFAAGQRPNYSAPNTAGLLRALESAGSDVSAP